MLKSLETIEGVVKNGALVTKKDARDNRKVLYQVCVNNDGFTWVSRNFVIECLNNPNIKVKNMILQGNSIKLNLLDSYKVVKINEKNIDILKKFIENYFREYSSAEEYMDYGYSTCDYFRRMKKENFSPFIKNGFMGLNNGSIETLFMLSKTSLGTSIIHTVYGEYSEELNKYVELLSSKLKNSIFYFEYLPNCFSNTSKFKIMKHNSSFDKDRAYMFYHGVYLTEYDVDLLPKMVEKKYFPDICLSEVEIKCVKAKELEKYFNNMRDDEYQGFWKSKYNNVAVSGFTYFHSEDFHANYGDIKYLIALYKNRIIGIVKFGVWPNSTHQALSYIDISVKYRRLGLATRMLKELNKYISSDSAFILTDESEMGKLCHMNQLAKRCIIKTKVKTYDECLRDGSYN